MDGIVTISNDDIQYLASNGLLLLLLITAAFLFYNWCLDTRKIPPGPIGLPVFGYLPFVGNKPHEVFLALGKKYGPMISLKLGTTLTVVLNEDKVLKEVLSHPSALNRPPDFFNHVPERGFFSMNGEIWQDQRKFCMQAIKDLGFGTSQWEKIMEEEITAFIEDLSSYQGQPLYVTDKVSRIAASTMLSLLIGRRIDKTTEKDKIDMIVRFMHFSMVNVGLSNPLSMFPLVRKCFAFFGIGDYNTSAETIESFSNFIREEITKQRNVPECKQHSGFLTSYMDKMNAMADYKGKHNFTDVNLRGNVNVLFLGGSDTVTTSLEYVLRFMAGHQEIQQKVHTELDEVLGRDGRITYSERAKVPYTMAVLMETQRLGCILTLNVSRGTSSDIEIRGFTIPKGSQIVANFYAVHQDPAFWEEPQFFRPERFLTTDGKSVRRNILSFVPFSTGRRNCPGEKVAWTEMLLFFTCIMQKFHVVSPPGQKTSFEAHNGVVSHLKQQHLCFIER